MDTIRALLAVALLGASAGASQGQQPQSPPAAERGEPAAAPAPEQAPPRRDASDDVFIPSEEIAADEEVTFPVDI